MVLLEAYRVLWYFWFHLYSRDFASSASCIVLTCHPMQPARLKHRVGGILECCTFPMQQQLTHLITLWSTFPEPLKILQVTKLTVASILSRISNPSAFARFLKRTTLTVLIYPNIGKDERFYMPVVKAIMMIMMNMMMTVLANDDVSNHPHPHN